MSWRDLKVVANPGLPLHGRDHAQVFFETVSVMSRKRRALRPTYESARATLRLEEERHEIHFDDELSEDGL